MTQTRMNSAREAIAQTVFGLLLSYVAGFIIYPMCGMPITGFSNLKVIGCFYLLSFGRQYVIRRWFNGENKNGTV